MRIIVGANNQLAAFGGDSLIPGDGQEARDSKLTLDDLKAADAQLAALGGPGEIWHDAKSDTLKVHARAKTVAEVDDDDRRDITGKLQAALDNWSTLTAAQKDSLLRVCVRAALRAVR